MAGRAQIADRRQVLEVERRSGVVVGAASRGKLGFAAAKRRWLEDVLARAETGALPALDDALATIRAKVKPAVFAELPDLHARLAAIDVATLLARSLRVGLIDELGWPALEAAARELDPDGKTAITIHGGLHAVVLASATRLIAVAPSGRLAAHDVVIPAKHELVSARYIGDQFLVLVREGWQGHAYWSAAPHDRFAIEGSAYNQPTFVGRATVLADGGWLEGGRAIRVGDRAWPAHDLASCDGTTAWISEWQDGRHKLREVSATGEVGRFSWPAFLDSGLRSGWHVDAAWSYVMPVPPPIVRSPLGVKDGLRGVRVWYRGDRQHQLERELATIDGRSWRGPEGVLATELLELPAGGQRPIVEETAWNQGTTASLFDEAGAVCGSRIRSADARYRRGTFAAYPTALWHAMSARDVAGSRRLRAVGDDDARSLLAQVPVGKTASELAALVPIDAVASVLPEISDGSLRRGVAGMVALAAELAAQRDVLRDERAPGMATAPAAAVANVDDATLKAAIGGWGAHSWGEGGAALAQLAAVAAWFRSPARADRVSLEVPPTSIDWLSFVFVPGALAFVARAAGTQPVHRAALGELAAALAALPEPAKLRTWEGTRTVTAHDVAEHGTAPILLRWHAGNAYVFVKLGYWSATSYRVLEYAPDGAFRVPPSYTASAEVCGRALAAADPRTDAPARFDTLAADAARLAAATGMTPSEAIYLLAGCPNMHDRSANFLAKELREQLGLKAAQAQLARDSQAAIPRAKRLAAIDEAGRASDTERVDVLAAAWIRHVGRRVAIAEALIADADRELQTPRKYQPAGALAMIGAATDAPELAVDLCFGLDRDGGVQPVAAPTPLVGQAKVEHGVGFDREVLQLAASYLPFLYAALPVGDPLRACAPVAHRKILERLANPALLFELGGTSGEADGALAGLLATLGGDDVAGLADGLSGRVVPGGVVSWRRYEYGTPAKAYVAFKSSLRPATLDAKAAVTLGRLVALFNGAGSWSPWTLVRTLRSDDVAAMMARIGDTPVAAGGWEQNPLASAPKLVERAAKQLGVGKDAAALYLQYLVLLWPIAKHLLQWNGWDGKRLAAATAELAERELVIEAKRERAQRTHFLPGGWEALKSPHPPFETWKLPFYGSRQTAQSAPEPILSRFLALAPFHLLFERAWKRIEAGDVPRYDEVKR